MFRLLKRFFAYFIDMMVILVIVQAISSITFINKNKDNYDREYNKYIDSYTEYYSFKLDLMNYYEDEKLSSKEYEKITEKYKDYKELVDEYYKDEKLSKKSYNKLISKLDRDYNKSYEKVYYKLEKYNIIYNIIYIIVVFLYFVLFNIITNGATLGKKLLRLRIVNNKDKEEKVSIFSYIIRCILLYQPLSYLTRVVLLKFLGVSDYYTVNSIIYNIHSYLEFIILTFVIVRLDGRGLHDLISNTRVIMLDKFGNEKEIKKLVK